MTARRTLALLGPRVLAATTRAASPDNPAYYARFVRTVANSAGAPPPVHAIGSAVPPVVSLAGAIYDQRTPHEALETLARRLEAPWETEAEHPYLVVPKRSNAGKLEITRHSPHQFSWGGALYVQSSPEDPVRIGDFAHTLHIVDSPDAGLSVWVRHEAMPTISHAESLTDAEIRFFLRRCHAAYKDSASEFQYPATEQAYLGPAVDRGGRLSDTPLNREVLQRQWKRVSRAGLTEDDRTAIADVTSTFDSDYIEDWASVRDIDGLPKKFLGRLFDAHSGLDISELLI